MARNRSFWKFQWSPDQQQWDNSRPGIHNSWSCFSFREYRSPTRSRTSELEPSIFLLSRLMTLRRLRIAEREHSSISWRLIMPISPSYITTWTSTITHLICLDLHICWERRVNIWILCMMPSPSNMNRGMTLQVKWPVETGGTTWARKSMCYPCNKSPLRPMLIEWQISTCFHWLLRRRTGSIQLRLEGSAQCISLRGRTSDC